MKRALLDWVSVLSALAVVALFAPNTSILSADDLKILFMGDQGPHQPARRFLELAPELEKMGIELVYTDRMSDIDSDTLEGFDGLLLYANIDRISDEQATALLDYVRGGKGFIPIHSATFCWRNNAEIVDLMGGQFQRHGAQVFRTEIAKADHPIMKGFSGFTSWDETYIHHMHNEQDRTVLEYRAEGEQARGNQREPWTWIKPYGKGRVFYTAWGHDHRTWTNPGFVNLVARGVRWACGDDPQKVPAFNDSTRFIPPAISELPADLPEFDFVDVGPKIPQYTPGESWGTQSKPSNLMQMPLSTQQSMRRYVHPVNMALRRYADEANFQAKPIAMTWDDRGRLWVCETVDYPNELGKDRDRIRICEDTNGDGVADKFTLFAEGLSIPTAIVFYRGGVIVQNGRETIFLKDTTGDDVADQKSVLITGWALGDTHGGVSNFRYGLDNWIWAMQGYNNSSPRIEGRRTQTFRQGFWRFKLSQTDPPQVTELEFIRSSDNNTWGLGISEEGLIFGSTANRNPSMFMPIPNRYYERVRGWAPSTLRSIADTHLFKPITDRVRQVDQFGGYTAGAGHALYTARAFPQQWWNKTAFVCGPTGHLVGTFVLRPEGANFSSSSPLNLLASNDEWAAPIKAEVGPDGAVWVIDWYNYIVQHNPTPHGFETGRGAAYVSDLRDKKRGRIYRVVAHRDDQDITHNIINLATADNSQLVENLKHPSFVWRLHAQRLLIERNAVEMAESLFALVRDTQVDDVGLNPGAIHGLWTLAGLGLLDSSGSNDRLSQLSTALSHPSAGVRRNALQLLPNSEIGLQMLLAHQDLFQDSDAQVRLQAILTLADMPESNQAGPLLAAMAARENDRILIDAVTSAAATHAAPFLAAALEKPIGDGSRSLNRMVNRIAEHIARGRPDAARLGTIVKSLGGTESRMADAVLEGLLQGLPNNFSVPSDEVLNQALASAFQAMHNDGKVTLVRLANRCQSDALDRFEKEIIDTLLSTVQNAGEDHPNRIAAAINLISFRSRDADIAEKVIAQVNAQTPPEAATQWLDTLRRSETEAVAPLLMKALNTLTPQSKLASISVILSKPIWTRQLLQAAQQGTFDINELSLEQQQTLRSSPSEEIRQQAEIALAQGGGLPDADRDKVLQELMPIVHVTGKVDEGREVFKNNCAICHKHGEMGQNIGPELTGMAVHPKEELLTHIIDPSRNVEGNYRLYNVLTIDGMVFSGMLANETRTSVSIIDSQGKEISIPRDEIEQLAASRKSVMPEGYEKQLSETQLTDLLEFLTAKDRYIPIPLDRFATAISTKALFTEATNGADQMIFSDWSPKTFNGVPFLLTDPQGQSRPNIILLNGPNGTLPPKMPKSVSMPCNTAARAIHFLSGVGGWSFPYSRRQTLTMIVRLSYADGEVEDHEWLNGVHFADYISRNDVPESEFAFLLRGQQLRYLSIKPKRDQPIETIELVKGDDNSSPIVMAITIER